MDQVTRVRKYIKREQWKALIQECQSSGMTVTAWCKANDICEQTYYATVIREERFNSNITVRIVSIPSVMRSWVLSHINECEVIGPKKFRDEIQKTIMEAYKKIFF